MIRLTFFQTLAYEVLNASKTVLSLFTEVDFWRHEQFFAEDNFVLIWQLEGSLVSVFVVGDAFVPILQKVAMLVFHLSHDFHCSPFVHLISQPVLVAVSVSVFSMGEGVLV